MHKSSYKNWFVHEAWGKEEAMQQRRVHKPSRKERSAQDARGEEQYKRSINCVWIIIRDDYRNSNPT